MNIQNIATKIDSLSHEWEEFLTKNTSNTKLQELEMKLSNIQSTLDMPVMDIGSIETKSSFGKFLRNGDTSLLETKSLSSVAPDEGGYLITPSLQKKINISMLSKSPMRQLASVDTISTNALDVIIQDGAFDSGWVADAEKRDDTNSPKLQQKRILVHELYAQPKATQRLLDDSAIDLEEWLTTQLQDSFVRHC